MKGDTSQKQKLKLTIKGMIREAANYRGANDRIKSK